MIYLVLFWTFLKIGALAFGGGYAMIAPVSDAVIQHQWMDEETFASILGVCESTPGPIAINMATYVGSSQAGFFGAVVATLGVVLPAVVIMLLFATILHAIKDHPLMKSTLGGIRPAALGLIVGTGVWMTLNQVFRLDTFGWNWRQTLLMAILFAIPPIIRKFFKKKFPAIGLIGVSAVLGILLF